MKQYRKKIVLIACCSICVVLMSTLQVSAQNVNLFSILSQYVTSNNQNLVEDIVISIVVKSVDTAEGRAMLDKYQSLFVKNIGSAVGAKKITTEQGNALIAKLSEARSFVETLGKKTDVEQKAAIAVKKSELATWSASQRIPQDISIFASQNDLSMMMQDFAAINGKKASLLPITTKPMTTKPIDPMTVSSTYVVAIPTATGVTTEVVSIVSPLTLQTRNATKTSVISTTKKKPVKKIVQKKVVKKALKKVPVKQKTTSVRTPTNTVSKKILPITRDQY